MYRYRRQCVTACVTASVLIGALARTALAEDWVEVLPPLTRSGAPRTDTSFGRSLSISGSSIFAGASMENNYTGAAYVLSGDKWQDQADILPAGIPDFPERYGQFGNSVNIRGQEAMVGTGRIDGGGVFFFSRATGTWKLSSSFIPYGVDAYGFNVALGDGFAVSSEPKSAGDVGRVCSYRRQSDGTWVSEPDIVATDPADQDFFGLRLSLNGNTLAVGAPTNLFYLSDRASVYVYVRENGAWDKGTRLQIEGPPAIVFGNSVSVHGDTLIVGAQPAAENDNNGKAVIYTRSGKAWNIQQTLTMPGEDTFGAPVLVQGDMAFVGASTAGSSSLYVFSRTGTAWTQAQKLSLGYGYSIAVNGGTLALGEAGLDSPGIVHVFRNASQDKYGDPDVTTGIGGSDAGATGGAPMDIEGGTAGAAASGGSGGTAGATSGGAAQAVGGGATASGGGSNAGGATTSNGATPSTGGAVQGPAGGGDSSGCGCRLTSRDDDMRSLTAIVMGLVAAMVRLVRRRNQSQ